MNKFTSTATLPHTAQSAPAGVPAPLLPLLESEDPKRVNTFSQLNQAAVFIGLAVFAFAALLIAILLLALPSLRPAVLYLYLAALLLAVAVACYLVISWNHEAAVRPWRIEDEDRYYRYAQLTAADPIPLPTSPDPSRLLLGGHNILALHYLHNSQATRPECEKSLNLDQADWNIINHCLKEVGIKTSRGWSDLDYQAALKIWITDLRADRDAILIRTSPNTWSRIPL